MKKFENPVLDVEIIEVIDVITTSGGDGCATYDCANDLGCPVDF